MGGYSARAASSPMPHDTARLHASSAALPSTRRRRPGRFGAGFESATHAVYFKNVAAICRTSVRGEPIDGGKIPLSDDLSAHLTFIP